MSKALVLCGGTGTRLRPFTFASAKQVLPVANKPIVHYIMEKLALAGIKDVGVIVSPEKGSIVRHYLGGGDRWGISVTFIEQDRPAGLAHAVVAAGEYLGDSPFLMYLGDNLVEAGLLDYWQGFLRGSDDAAVFLKEVDDPRQFGVAVIDDGGKLVRVEEKPAVPPSNLALTGIYFFRKTIHGAIDRIKPSWRGEMEITDAIQSLIDAGGSVGGHIMGGWWHDTGSVEDLLQANSVVLKSMECRPLQEKACPRSTLEGAVAIGEGSRVINSLIKGLVVIGDNVTVKNSFIGPDVSVGDSCLLDGTRIENTIIMHGCDLAGISLKDSMIGSCCSIHKRSAGNGCHRMVVGDHSLIAMA
ncbi:MAG: glucose-1-phosphate thymidylyltransferase [Desulfocucumaceae bacterium]